MRTCDVDRCDRSHYAKGYCVMHYNRMRAFGDPGTAEPQRLREPGAPCTVDGCSNAREGHGLCVKHLRRMTTHGTVSDSVGQLSSLARFERNIEKRRNGCWLWTGPLQENGYARAVLDGRRWLVHRWSYTHFVGAISPNLVIDHLCEVRSCVNPEHLRACSQQINVTRSATALAAVNSRKTECLRGHPFDAVNTYINPRTGSRLCRACRRRGASA